MLRGDLVFKEITPNQIKFDFDDNPKILTNRNLDLARELAPLDFEHEKYEIKATYYIEVVTTEK